MYTKHSLLIAVQLTAAILASVIGTPKSSAREGRADDFPSVLRPSAIKVVAEFKSHYIGLAASNGLPLEISFDSQSALTSARAEIDEGGASITVDAGLMKSDKLSSDGLRVILCHELGHILGGAPRKSLPMEWDGAAAADGESLMSSEGQADYYATLVCFRQLVSGQDHKRELSLDKSSPASKLTLKTLCDRSHGSESEGSLICQRAAMGSENFLQLSKTFEISFKTPSSDRAPATIRDSYPDRQCRLDTLLAGAMCPSLSRSFALDFNNAAKNECAQSLARRPTCWYR